MKNTIFGHVVLLLYRTGEILLVTDDCADACFRFSKLMLFMPQKLTPTLIGSFRINAMFFCQEKCLGMLIP